MNLKIHVHAIWPKLAKVRHDIGSGLHYKLLIMKLIILLTIGLSFNVWASTYSQHVTLQLKKASLKTVLQSIQRQSGYSFMITGDQIEQAKPVTVDIKDKDIKEVLPVVFKDQPFTYEVGDMLIKVLPKKNTNTVQEKTNQQPIRGKVMNENGQPLVGASIQLQGTNIVATTGKDGSFALISDDASGWLIVSYMGYTTEQMKFSIGSFGPFNVVLKPTLSELKEVEINAGYYTVKDRERTGNIMRIDAETIEKQPVSNPLQAMQNRVPGVQITQITGIAGGGIDVQIRGRSSLNSQVGNDPLYIIDGVIYPSSKASLNYGGNILGIAGTNPLSLINPTDIESIEVLKDADATAIYGSKGANGVILIKTKRGQAGATRINANFVQGYSKVASYIDMLNTPQYLEMRREAIANDGKAPSALDYDINGTWDENKYTDWQKVLIGRTAPSTKAALNFTGGTEKVSYLLGGNYYKESTVFPGEFGFNRSGVQSSLNFGTEKSRLTIGFNANYNRISNKLIRTDLTSLITLAPNAPDLYDEYGQLNWENNTVYQNPMAYLLVKNNINTDNLIGNMILNYRIVEKLSFRLSTGYNLIKTDEFNKIPMAYISPANNPTAANRRSQFSNISNRTWIAEPQLNYGNRLGDGNFEALIGMTFQDNISDIRSVTASNFSNDELMENQGAAGSIVNNLASYSQYRYIAAYTRLNYSLNNRYFLNLTARRDGSSRFGSDKRFANFGAIGSAWIFSEENFIKNDLPFLSFGKLRASYGVTGNDQIPDYGYLQLYNTSGTYQGIATIIPNAANIGNPDFAWETNHKLEFSLQLGFLANKINIETSWYRNRSSNQLIGDTLPLSTGSISVRANMPALVENTGWEILGNFKILQHQNWGWSSSINLTIPKNKVIDYPGLEQSGNAMDFIIGEPLAIFKTYNVRGVDSQTGLYDIEDYDGNGVLDDKDRYLYKFIGQYYYGGFQNNISYRNFTLDFLIGFTKQNGNNYISTRTSPGLWSSNTYFTGNQPVYVLDRWKSPGDQSDVQKFSTNSAFNSPYSSARNFGGLSIEDASYIRLKNISFSYALPKNWLNRMGISKTDLTLSAQNVLTITNYKGLDPETQSMNVLPPLKTFAVGINVTF